MPMSPGLDERTDETGQTDNRHEISDQQAHDCARSAVGPHDTHGRV